MTDLSRLRAVSADESTVAEFVPGAGMVCCSLRHHGEERLDARKGLEAYALHGSTMGMPLLYPWANRLGGSGYDVAGRRVTLPHDPARIHMDSNGLPIHGVAPGLMRWQPAATDRENVIAARLRWASPPLLELFPFAHEVEFDASVETGGLEIATTVRASAGDRVPVAFGFHPYLRLEAARAAWSVALPAGRRLTLDERMLPTGERRPLADGPVPLDGGDFDDAVELAGANSIAESAGADSADVELASAGSARFSASAPGRRFVVEFLEGFGFAQIYSPRDSSFVCFEPMTAPANALRSGDGLRVLEPGEEHRAVFRLGFE